MGEKENSRASGQRRSHAGEEEPYNLLYLGREKGYRGDLENLLASASLTLQAGERTEARTSGHRLFRDTG